MSKDIRSARGVAGVAVSAASDSEIADGGGGGGGGNDQRQTLNSISKEEERVYPGHLVRNNHRVIYFV